MTQIDPPSKVDEYIYDWYVKLEYMYGDKWIEWWALFQFAFVTLWSSAFGMARYQFTGVTLDLEPY